MLSMPSNLVNAQARQIESQHSGPSLVQVSDFHGTPAIHSTGFWLQVHDVPAIRPKSESAYLFGRLIADSLSGSAKWQVAEENQVTPCSPPANCHPPLDLQVHSANILKTITFHRGLVGLEAVGA